MCSKSILIPSKKLKVQLEITNDESNVALEPDYQRRSSENRNSPLRHKSCEEKVLHVGLN